MKRLSAWLLFALLQCASPVLFAAEPETPAANGPEDTTSQTAPAAASTETTGEEDATPGTMAADDTFVPTVEISEDLSVSFPSDI
jgi:hypothetical protein